MKFILKFSVLWIKCLQKHVGVSIFHCNLLELFQVFSNWINWKPKIYNRWKGLKSNLPEIFTLWVQSNHSQIPLKSTEHFSHRNPTKKKRSALIFFQCSPTVWDTQEIWRAQQSYRMMELQLSDTFFPQFLEDMAGSSLQDNTGLKTTSSPTKMNSSLWHLLWSDSAASN